MADWDPHAALEDDASSASDGFDPEDWILAGNVYRWMHKVAALERRASALRHAAYAYAVCTPDDLRPDDLPLMEGWRPWHDCHISEQPITDNRGALIAATNAYLSALECDSAEICEAWQTDAAPGDGNPPPSIGPT